MNLTVSRYVRIALLILVGYLLATSFGHLLYVVLQAVLWIPITAFSWSFKTLTSRSGFDPVLCASLHNEIVSKIPASMLEEHHTKIVHNWFTAYGKEASKIRWKLTSPLIKFLENIDVPLRTDGRWTPINIAPHVHLASPGDLWSPVGGLGTDGLNLNDWDWVALYRGNMQEVDIYFNMQTNLVVWQHDVMSWEQHWYPLERALRLWLSLYDSGKIKPSIGEAMQDPTAVTQYVPSDLSLSLTAYHELLEAIASRCEGCTIGGPGLISRRHLNHLDIFGFLRDFYLEARRPSFTFIAPCISVPNSTWLNALLIEDKHSARYMGNPLPLFPGPNITSRHEHFWNKDYIHGDVSGLYSWPANWFSDAVRFILPYPLGEAGYIQEGHGGWSVVGNDHLYQHGNCPFLDDAHNPRLFTVLRSWTRMVQSGKWKVGPDGVRGGIEKFRDADTAWYAKSYRVGACFDEG